jgi:lipoprotein-anchoring transpeptidase ErfK/SrfK
LKLAPASAPGRPLLGYGIHGAKDESTVGRSLSNGCIRMRNADVENLYYLVPAGCRVNIVEK